MREFLIFIFLAIAARAVSCDQVCNFANSYLRSSTGGSNTTSPTTCHLPIMFLDQGSAYQVHSNFPANYWFINGLYNQPNLGTAGTANGGAGFSDSDFEMPLFRLGNEDAPDPDLYIINGETGLVGIKCMTANKFTDCGELDPVNRLPVYNYRGRSPLYMVTSPDTFHNFFHSAIENTQVKLNFTFTRDPYITALQQFNSNAYFPLDNKGFNDTGFLSDNKTSHNFGFCMIMNMRFTYKGGEYIYIAGDDDIFVYVNDSLVVDMGGVHATTNSTFYVDDMGLVQGNSYRLDIFRCERHTPTSVLSINTTMDVYCSYVDVCGLCEGNGASCCNYSACDDGNACTTDSCGITTACVHTPITCASQDPCYKASNSTCDPKVGCSYTPVTCTDNNPCTTDVCTYGIGCQFLPKDCDDLNLCTDDSCSNSTGLCVYTAHVCDDHDNCTNSLCYEDVGCIFAPLPCEAPDMCSVAVCTHASGCNISARVCNDNNNCTIDSCDPTYGCVFAPVLCSANISSCSKVCTTGNATCVNASTCNDGIACTIDKCVNGTCQNSPLCPSGTPCSPITCEAGVCVQQNISCDTGNLCLVGTCAVIGNTTAQCQIAITNCTNSTCSEMQCDSGTGQCVIPQLSCDDRNPCTTDFTVCDATGLHCNYTFNPTACDDNNKCTNDYCNVTVNGTNTCSHTNLTCIPPSACMRANTCDPKLGCSFVPIVCAAITDFCHISVCDEVAGCIIVEKACPVPDNVCYQGICNNGSRSCSTEARPNWDLIINRNGQTCTAAYAKTSQGFWTLTRIIGISVGGGIFVIVVVVLVLYFAVFRGRTDKKENPLYDKNDGRGKNPLYG